MEGTCSCRARVAVPVDPVPSSVRYVRYDLCWARSPMLWLAASATSTLQQCASGQCDLVISRCHESVSWIMQQSHEHYRHVVIYNKCGVAFPAASIPNRTIVVEMRNIGSCDGAYLQHINSYYSNLAPITLFCKSAHPKRCGTQTLVGPAAETWSKATWKAYEQSMNQGFYRFDTAEKNRPAAFKRKVVTRQNVRSYSQPTYKMQSWKSSGISASKRCYVPSGYANYSSWLANVLGSQALADRVIDAGKGVVLGGYFAAERSSLLRYPRELYATLAAMQQAPNAEVDHFIERTWGLLLTASNAVPISSDLHAPPNRENHERCRQPSAPSQKSVPSQEPWSHRLTRSLLRGQNASVPRCYSRQKEFMEPVRGTWAVETPAPETSWKRSKGSSRSCPLLRTWEYCPERRAAGEVHGRTFIPNGCQLAHVDGMQFLEMFDGRQLVFAGDSTHVQFAIAFGCMMQAQGINLDKVKLKYKPLKALKKRCGSTPVGKCHWDDGEFILRPKNPTPGMTRGVTIRSCFVYTIDDTGPVSKCLSDLKPTDVVVYGSAGVHFRETVLTGDARYVGGVAGGPLSGTAAPAAASLEAITVIRTLNGLPEESKPLMIWREVSAQHFSTPGGHFVGGYDYNQLNETKVCTAHSAEEMAAHQRWNPVANAILEAHGVPILRVWESSQMAHDAHVGFGDCTHFCSPQGVPDHWAALLVNMLHAMRPASKLLPFLPDVEGQSCFLPKNAAKGCLFPHAESRKLQQKKATELHTTWRRRRTARPSAAPATALPPPPQPRPPPPETCEDPALRRHDVRITNMRLDVLEYLIHNEALLQGVGCIICVSLCAFAVGCPRRFPRTAWCLFLVMLAASFVFRDIIRGVSSGDTTSCRNDCDMVVAHCTEDVSWIIDDAPNYRRVFLHTKCQKPIPPAIHAAPNIQVLQTPNVGSNDYPYMLHIISHYNDLAPFTLFCEAGINGYGPKGTGEGSGRTTTKLKHSSSATRSPVVKYCTPEIAVRPSKGAYSQWPHARPKLWTDSGLTQHHLLWKRDSALSSFSLNRHVFAHNPESREKFAFVRSGYRNFGDWFKRTIANVTGNPDLAWRLLADYEYLVVGGWMGVERDNIRRYPLELFKAMAGQQKSPNEEVDHFIERAWGVLFTTPHLPCGIFGKAGRKL